MLNAERVTELARSIVHDRLFIVRQGGAARIDNNLHDGIELARAVVGGYISQLTTAGERRLIATFNALAELRNDLAAPMAYPWAEVTNIETIDGATVLTGLSNLLLRMGKHDHHSYATPASGPAFKMANDMITDLGFAAVAWHAGTPGTIRTGLRPL
jgi:hypothetical protein